MKNPMTIGRAKASIGSLGFPSKMPGTSYGLPALACIAGAKLAKIPGTVCNTCYALGGRASYQMPRAQKGQRTRLASLTHPKWVEAMVRVLARVHAQPKIKVDLGIVGIRLKAKGGSRYRFNDSGFHRWHDSGDLQSVDHLARICEVVRLTPNVRHWLPTQELWMVDAYLETGATIPENLVIRVSSVFVDDAKRRAWPHTSSVYKDAAPSDAWICPAPQQGHMCGSCRKCWSSTAHIAYASH